MKGKDPKKINIFEVNGVQHKYRKNMGNKIGDTLHELYLPQNYDYTFFRIKTKGRTENYTCEPHQQRKL